jgi:hypothetical protein
VNAARLLQLEADAAFQELLASLDGVPERLAWARIELRPGEYLHTEGSILSNVVHVAGCKLLYGSAAYRNLEIRWRDAVARMEEFWPDWEAAKAWLREAHAYWMASWQGETDLERMVDTNWGDRWPSWQVISSMIRHDAYHAGQIQILRTTQVETHIPPPRESAIWKEFSSEFSW